MIRSRLALAAAGCSLALVAGCGSSSDATATSGTSSTIQVSGSVTVLAAASLTEAFNALAKQYEQAHPGVKIALSFGSSTTLAQQVAQGAPADLVAFAGDAAVAQLPAADQSKDKQTSLGKNVLEIATPKGNPKGVTGLADLAKPSVAVVLCVSTAPCGKAADQILKTAKVTPHIVSRELDVKATLTKVRLNEVDAAIVYHSDVVSAGTAVTGVEIPAAQNTTLNYPLVRITDTAAATGFAAYLSSPEGLKELASEGFLAP